MALYLSNEDQAKCLTPKLAIDALSEGLRAFARGDAIRRPRFDNLVPTTRPDEFFDFSSMEGGVRAPGYYAIRIKPDIISWPVVDGVRRRVTYASRPGLYGGLVLLFDTDTADLLAILNDGFVQHARVAATAALGMRYLSREDASVVAMIGSGGMARAFAPAAAAVRPVRRVQAYSPNAEHLAAYCRDMADALGREVVACDSIAAAADGADILCVCTNSLQPVVGPEAIRPGIHVANVTAREMAPEAHRRIEVVGVLARRTPIVLGGFADDDFAIRTNVMTYAGGQPDERAKIPAGSLHLGLYENARIVDCVDWETGRAYQRERKDEITTLASASHGTIEGEAGSSGGIQGLQFACVAGAVYERARALGLGTGLPRDMFLQDIPT